MSDLKIHEINPDLIDRLYPAIYLQIVEGTEVLSVKDMKILRDMVIESFDRYIIKMESKEMDIINLNDPTVYHKITKNW